MFHLDLDDRMQEQFWDTAFDSHQIDVDVGIHDPSGDRVSSFALPDGTSLIEEGSVQVDATQDVSRQLSLGALDLRGDLQFEPDSPKVGGIYMGYFVSAHYEIFLPAFGSWPSPASYPDPSTWPGDSPATATDGVWIRCPVFFGPLTSYEQIGHEITVGAQGMETRGLAPFYVTNGYHLPKHMHTDAAIAEVLDRAGFWRVDTQHLPFRIKEDRPVHPQDEAWRVVNGGGTDSQGNDVKGLIERTGPHPHHLFCDALGRARVKRRNKEPVFTFDETMMTTPATWDFTHDGFFNAVDVRGGKGKGKGKTRAHALVELPADHPLSPDALRTRNGRKIYITRFENVPNLKTDHDCRQRGRHLLRHVELAGAQVSFDCGVVPTLEELDMVVVETSSFSTRYPIKQYTLPLGSGDMTIGDTKRVKRRGSHNRDHGGSGHHPPHHGAGAGRGGRR